MHSMYVVLLWPFVVYAMAVVVLASGILVLSRFLGERHQEPVTDDVFESGIKPTGDARLHFSVDFYTVALFFVIFDLEAVFIMAWAVSMKELGWAGYIALSIFIIILIVVLLYEWRMGALDFGPSGKKILKAYRKKKERN